MLSHLLLCLESRVAGTNPVANCFTSFIRHPDVEDVLDRLRDPQRATVHLISMESASVRETAMRLMMTKVAVRFSPHRAPKSLAALYQRKYDRADVRAPGPSRSRRLWCVVCASQIRECHPCNVGGLLGE